MRYTMKWLITGLLTAVLCIFSVANVMAATSNSKMNVQLSVKPYLSLSISNTFSSVAVSSGDLAAGYKDFPSATSVTATTNSTNGFVISVLLKNTTFGVQQVYPSGTVTVDGVTYPLTPGVYTNITVPYNGSQTQTKILSYRFNLNPALAPATYAWPILITGSAL